MNKLLKIIFLALPLIGLADAAYLTILHYTEQAPACSLIKGCEIVLSSVYAEIQGVPIALIGAVYYAMLFVLLYAGLNDIHSKPMKFAGIISTIGFVVTLCLIYIQAFIIHAFCQFCLISALTTILIFIGIALIYLNNRKIKTNQEIN